MEFDKAVAELEALVATLEREGDERALLLLELVDAIHRPGLELIAAGHADHPVAQALLSMYDLAEVDDAILVEEALDDVRPYVESHGGEVELLSVDDGVVRLRMSGACAGCAASTMTLRRGIETALREHYPGFREVVAEEQDGGGRAPQLIQLEGVKRPVFAEAGEVADVPVGQCRAAEVEGIAILLANVDGELYAFRDGCPVDGRPLEGGRLNGPALICPWHNCAFDARSGRRLDDEQGGPGLAAVPVAIDGGRVRVAVNVA